MRNMWTNCKGAKRVQLETTFSKLNIQISTKSILENLKNKKLLLQFRLWMSKKNIFNKWSDSSEQAVEVSFDITYFIIK
jgi:hypothetical protein